MPAGNGAAPPAPVRPPHHCVETDTDTADDAHAGGAAPRLQDPEDAASGQVPVEHAYRAPGAQQDPRPPPGALRPAGRDLGSVAAAAQRDCQASFIRAGYARRRPKGRAR